MHWLANIINAFSKPLKWWVVIAPWEKGLRVRFGKTVKELNPGPHFRIPFLDRIYVQPSRLRYAAYSGHTISSKDEKVFSIGIAVRYRIENLKQLYLTIADPEATIYLAAISAISDYICSSHSDQVTPKSISEIADNAVKEVGKGMEDLKVSVVNFSKVKCYRFITGDGWITGSMHNFDNKDNAGEK